MEKVLIVGSGIVGCVIAREMADLGLNVEIWDRRNHIGGNMYDYKDEYGILVHKYGPHIFHTNNERVYEYMMKYAEWKKFHLICGALIDDICTPTAFNLKTIDLFYTKERADELKRHIKNVFGDRESATVVELLDSEDDLIRGYAQFLFDKDYSLYTAKQWGMDPKEVDKSILKRVPIRFTYDESYFKDKYEMMPLEGYHALIEALLDHPQISIKLGVEALDHIKISNGNILIDNIVIDYPVVYTGPVDELFEYSEGKLPYRSLRFEWRHEEIDSFQEYPVVAYPQAHEYTRITEYKKLPIQEVNGTSYAVEYPLPYVPGQVVEPYYPVITNESAVVYAKYEKKANVVKGLYLCGRLADFKYYNMDQAVERAFEIVDKLSAIID
ncbi:UDP-galactopyranose mutase [Lacrimispora defluvii]|uniref:UDP-galactopyranose mutase n=1 Tax=Lacrimispora defluvii TaxID=2719233 RepID=A0ABX1VXQ8_9FIRM|nr:UDP-galactopyranose mutase [Lacrimispora defluvii]NNJ32820.1 UDP-galactopyranose mutase [Lacrimispora defluvii]